MIQNDTEMHVTMFATARMERQMIETESAGCPNKVKPEVWLLGLQAMHQQIADLHVELAEYYRERLDRKFRPVLAEIEARAK